MKNALAVIIWFVILVVSFTNAFSAKQIGDISNQTTSDDKIPASELANFHDYINFKINEARHKDSTDKSHKTLKIIDSKNPTYIERAWIECSKKSPCSDQTHQILGHLSYSVAAKATDGSKPKKQRIMLASWEDYCNRMGKNNVSCQPFNEPIYFRALDKGGYEVYLRVNNK